MHRLNMGSRGRMIGPTEEYPRRFRQLCEESLAAARAVDGSLPFMEPGTLLVNFYKPAATFKWHQVR